MSLEDWDGLEVFLSNGNPEENMWMTMQETPSYMEPHQEALDTLEGYRDAYMMAYGIEHEHLINPDTKYNTEGLV